MLGPVVPNRPKAYYAIDPNNRLAIESLWTMLSMKSNADT